MPQARQLIRQYLAKAAALFLRPLNKAEHEQLKQELKRLGFGARAVSKQGRTQIFPKRLPDDSEGKFDAEQVMRIARTLDEHGFSSVTVAQDGGYVAAIKKHNNPTLYFGSGFPNVGKLESKSRSTAAAKPKLTIAQLLGELKKIEAAQQQKARDFSGDPNPQVKAMLLKATTRLEMVQAIIASIHGDQTDIRIYY